MGDFMNLGVVVGFVRVIILRIGVMVAFFDMVVVAMAMIGQMVVVALVVVALVVVVIVLVVVVVVVLVFVLVLVVVVVVVVVLMDGTAFLSFFAVVGVGEGGWGEVRALEGVVVDEAVVGRGNGNGCIGRARDGEVVFMTTPPMESEKSACEEAWRWEKKKSQKKLERKKKVKKSKEKVGLERS